MQYVYAYMKFVEGNYYAQWQDKNWVNQSSFNT